MKPIIAWAKKNLIVVISVPLTLIVLGVAFFFSEGWNSKIRTEMEKKATDELTKVTSTKVSYTLPQVLPGAEAVSLSTEPNERVTEFFRERREEMLRQAAVVSEQGLKFNARTPLLEGIFPKAATREAFQIKSLEFAEIIIGGPGRPSAYQKLLAQIKAGDAPSAEQIKTILTDTQEREFEKLRGGRPDRAITPEENAEITRRLVDLRRAEYVRRSSELGTYMGLSALQGGGGGQQGPRGIPTVPPTQPPPLGVLFAWQFDYWTVADVMQAIGRVNGIDQGRTGVDRSVVKRVERLLAWDRVTSGGGSRSAEEGGPDPSLLNQMAPVSFRVSPSGRFGSPGNQIYDVRYVDMSAIVSSARLPEFFNALAATNYMTVIDCDLESVDPWEHLEQGYYYGDEPVVRANMRIEVLWLRKWTAPLMPASVRKAYAVAWEEPATPEGQPPADDGQDGAAAPTGGEGDEGGPAPGPDDEDPRIREERGGRGGRGPRGGG